MNIVFVVVMIVCSSKVDSILDIILSIGCIVNKVNVLIKMIRYLIKKKILKLKFVLMVFFYFFFINLLDCFRVFIGLIFL